MKTILYALLTWLALSVCAPAIAAENGDFLSFYAVTPRVGNGGLYSRLPLSEEYRRAPLYKAPNELTLLQFCWPNKTFTRFECAETPNGVAQVTYRLKSKNRSAIRKTAIRMKAIDGRDPDEVLAHFECKTGCGPDIPRHVFLTGHDGC